jgi:hypothetical protein
MSNLFSAIYDINCLNYSKRIYSINKNAKRKYFQQIKTMSDDIFYFDDRLLEPLNYLTKIPGKKIRTKLIQVTKKSNY